MLGFKQSTLRWARFLSMATQTQPGPVEIAIREKLTVLLEPSVLTIQNDSAKHSTHSAMRTSGGGNGETHFSLHIVSDVFQGQKTMERHRLIYKALSDEFEQGLHALSLNTKTISEVPRSNE